MSSNTSKDTSRPRSSLFADIVELLSSMRFAISLLTVISIASVIGTVLNQNGPNWFT